MGDDIEAVGEATFWGSPAEPELEPHAPDGSAALEPAFTIPPIAGFWRRVGAFALDMLLLGVVGQIIAWPLRSFWFELGPNGRFIGFVIGLLYFGLMDSRLGNGQTLGKRVLRIAVRDSNGECVSVGTALKRMLVWFVPLALNGWGLAILLQPIPSIVANIIITGLGGAVVLTMVFNRRSRQGLHDMLTRTYVLQLTGEPVEALPTAAKLQWVLVAVAFGLAVVGIAVNSFFVLQPDGAFTRALQVQRALAGDDRFHSVSVMDQTFYEFGGEQTRTLKIRVWFKGDMPSETEWTALSNSIAKKVGAIPGTAQYDYIDIGVTAAFDLWIATGQMTYGEAEAPHVWAARTR